MRAILVVSITWWAAAALGRSIIDLFGRNYTSPLRNFRSLEKFVFGSALGLGIIMISDI